MKPDLLLQEMNAAAKSTNSLDFIFNHFIRVMVPFDPLTYSTHLLLPLVVDIVVLEKMWKPQISSLNL